MDELYGLFKKNSADNHFVSLAKSLNSAYATKYTRKTLKKLESYCSHGSELEIRDGVCYLCYIRNTAAFDDDEFSPNLELVLARFKLERVLADDFEPTKDVTRAVLGRIGTEYLGEPAYTCPKGGSMCFIGDELFISTSFLTEDGKNRFCTITYDTRAEKVTEYTWAKLRRDGALYDLTDDTINALYEEAGYPRTEPSIIEPIARWSEYRGEYYSTFLIGSPTPNNGILVKTRDFKTFDFISVIPYNENGCAEATSAIFDGKLFVACRQKWTTPYMLLLRYDIDEGKWHVPYRIEDANSRPWIFEHKDDLYLYNTIDEGFRTYSNISKIRTSKKAHNGKNNPIDTIATLHGCGAYAGFSVYGDRIFFASSIDGFVHFGELIMKQHDPTAVGERLLELFSGIDGGEISNEIAIGATRNSDR